MSAAFQSPPPKPADTYTINGAEVAVNYLIYYEKDPTHGAVLVYVDHELDLEWECDSEFGKVLDTLPLKGDVRRILNGVAALEPVAHNWPADLKLVTKRMLGEAIATVLLADVEGAEKALATADKFIRAKSKQVSRSWTLKSCLAAGAAASVAALLELLLRIQLVAAVGPEPFLLSLCFWAGAVGAMFFIVMELGKRPKTDSTAERHLHYLEGVARIAGGGVGGILVGALVKLGLILPIFHQVGTETLAMCTAAMIGGASERLAAGIITKVETNDSLNSN